MNNAQRTISIKDCTHCFAVPGERSIVDCIDPVTGRGWYSDDDLEQIQARYPLVEIMLIDDHCSAVAKRQDVHVVWT